MRLKAELNAQSVAYNNGLYYVQKIQPGLNGQGGYIEVYDKSGKYQKRGPWIGSLHHGNGLAYNPNDNCLYSVTAKGRGDNTKAQVIDAGTLKHVRQISLPHGAGGIAYGR